MAKVKTYVITEDFKTPYVVATGMPHKPSQIKVKRYRKGDIIKGTLIERKGGTSFVMVGSTLVVPLSVIKEVVTKDIVFNQFDGTGASSGSAPKLKVPTKPVDPKIQYLDAVIIGSLAGFIGAHIAEKKEWIPIPEEGKYNNKLAGAVIGAALGAYIVFKIRSKKVGVAKTVKE